MATTGEAPRCGDGEVEGEEECDAGAENGGYQKCTLDCALPASFCGDGAVTAPEACDDGDADDHDGCSGCQVGSCGDGVVGDGEACDNGSRGGGLDVDGCPSKCGPEYLMVFVSKGTTTGKIEAMRGAQALKGLEAADQRCQAEAHAAGLAGTYRAWLSSATTAAASRVAPKEKTKPYFLTNAVDPNNGWSESWTALIGPIDPMKPERVNQALSIAADKSLVGGLAWTNTSETGETLANHCADWTSTSSQILGGVGDLGKLTSEWTNKGGEKCDTWQRLYCFQTDHAARCGDGLRAEGAEACDDAAPENDVDGCPSSCRDAHRVVFVSTTTTSGKIAVSVDAEEELVGLEAADAICQSDAETLGLGGSYRAWLSTGEVPAHARLGPEFPAHEPWLLVGEGTKIGEGLASITAGQGLLAGITTKDETITRVWTNTRGDGGPAGRTGAETCEGWTSDAPERSAVQGVVGATDARWTLGAAAACDAVAALLCVQVSLAPPG